MSIVQADPRPSSFKHFATWRLQRQSWCDLLNIRGATPLGLSLGGTNQTNRSIELFLHFTDRGAARLTTLPLAYVIITAIFH